MVMVVVVVVGGGGGGGGDGGGGGSGGVWLPCAGGVEVAGLLVRVLRAGLRVCEAHGGEGGSRGGGHCGGEDHAVEHLLCM